MKIFGLLKSPQKSKITQHLIYPLILERLRKRKNKETSKKKNKIKHKRGLSSKYSRQLLTSISKTLEFQKSSRNLNTKNSHIKTKNNSIRNKLYKRLYESKSHSAIRSANNIVRMLRSNSNPHLKGKSGKNINREELLKLLSDFKSKRAKK